MNQAAEEVEVIPTRYELLVLSSGAEVVWRKRPGKYPEELHGGRWLSDFGLGDYESDRSVSERRLVVDSWIGLPDHLHEEIRKANDRDSFLVRLAEKPPATDSVLLRIRRLLGTLLGR